MLDLEVVPMEHHWDYDAWLEQNLNVNRKLPKTYNVRMKVSELFPVKKDEEWDVKEHGRTVEHWKVVYVEKKNTYFDAEVTEFLEDENA